MTDSRTSAPRLLAGLQAGILAGLVTLGWLILLSYSYFQGPWALLNVLAASLRNNTTWGHGFSTVTWTGISAHLAACGFLGIGLGWILPRPGPHSRTSVTGLIFGVVLSLFIYQFFWLRFAPLLGEYIAPLAMWVSHLLVGLSLAQFPRFYLKLAEPELTRSELEAENEPALPAPAVVFEMLPVEEPAATPPDPPAAEAQAQDIPQPAQPPADTAPAPVPLQPADSAQTPSSESPHNPG